jgi:hypothetical protein
LIEVRGRGSAFIWLLETPGAYKAFALADGFDFVNAPLASWIISDLNGDPSDSDEIAIYISTPPGVYHLDAPRVYNLSQVPPKSLPFLPDQEIAFLGIDFENYWAVRPNEMGSNDLVFVSRVYPPCPATVQRTYRWNGEYFALPDRYQPGSAALLPGNRGARPRDLGPRCSHHCDGEPAALLAPGYG